MLITELPDRFQCAARYTMRGTETAFADDVLISRVGLEGRQVVLMRLFADAVRVILCDDTEQAERLVGRLNDMIADDAVYRI